jgi:predicted dinucleotide-binding enzyme
LTLESDVDVIILSIPFARYPDLKQTLSQVPEQVVVIDTSNYYPQRSLRAAFRTHGVNNPEPRLTAPN